MVAASHVRFSSSGCYARDKNLLISVSASARTWPLWMDMHGSNEAVSLWATGSPSQTAMRSSFGYQHEWTGRGLSPRRKTG